MVLIKGVDMPEGDEVLSVNIFSDGKVTRQYDLRCEAIAIAEEVPTPHGDLVDRSKIRCLGNTARNVGMNMKSICETCKDSSCMDYETRADKECLDYEPMTNADRIRAMTDEELAEWIAKHMYCAECMYFNDETGTCNYEYRYGKGCNGAMLDWLKQEVENERLIN